MDAVLTGGTNWWHDASNAMGVSTATGMSNAKHTLTFSFMAVANSARASGAGCPSTCSKRFQSTIITWLRPQSMASWASISSST